MGKNIVCSKPIPRPIPDYQTLVILETSLSAIENMFFISGYIPQAWCENNLATKHRRKWETFSLSVCSDSQSTVTSGCMCLPTSYISISIVASTRIRWNEKHHKIYWKLFKFRCKLFGWTVTSELTWGVRVGLPSLPFPPLPLPLLQWRHPCSWWQLSLFVYYNKLC